MNITDRFIEHLFELRKAQFDSSAIQMAKRCLLDYLGVTIAGSKLLSEKGRKLIELYGNDSGVCSLIGHDKRSSLEVAILVNGMSSHIAELDDGTRFGGVHVGSPVISALLPVAEKEKINGIDLITGIIIGYEAAIRVASSVQPSHYSLGFHPTSTCGSIGAAMGISAMLGFSKAEMKNAFSAAAISAGGTLKVLEDESELKPFNTGRAGLIGLHSSYIGRAGFLGPDDAFSGDTGFFSTMSRGYDESKITSYQNKMLEIEKIYFKPYASCRHSHPAVESVIKLKKQYNLNIQNIDKIRVITYSSVIGKHDYSDVVGIASAKMSIPFSIAVALATGKAGINEFSTQYINSPSLLSLAKKVAIIADSEITALVPNKRAAVVEVFTNDGNFYSERVDYPKGEPENPMTDIEFEEKFFELNQFANKPKDVCRQIVEKVWGLEDNLNYLFPLL